MRVSLVLGVHLGLAQAACVALDTGVYQTLPGATVEERGDRVLDGSRVVALSATLKFDLSATPPSLVAVVTDAVLEGGDSFGLTVQSSFGIQLTNGTYQFTGDYLRELHPEGTQYLFDWKFSTTADGRVRWDGVTGWAGGHLWQVTISNIALAPQALLSISSVGAGSVQIAWPANLAGYVLESADGLPAAGWSPVTNATTNTGDRLSVTMATGSSQRFYRLRKPPDRRAEGADQRPRPERPWSQAVTAPPSTGR